MYEYVKVLAVLAVMILGQASGIMQGEQIENDRWQTLIHNAYHTGDEIMVDGVDYSVIVMPGPARLQAYRSEYARHCQAVTKRFFEGVDDATNK